MVTTSVSVVIPAYNESKNIAATLHDIEAFRQESPELIEEILVVDDGSKDNTSHIVENLTLTMAGLRCINNTTNQGKGAVIRQGMLAATSSYALFMDADNSTNIREIKKFLPHLEAGYDFVIGSRRLNDPQVTIQQPKKRKLLGSIYIALTNVILGLSAGDYNCGFKVFKKEHIPQLFSKQRMNNFSFDVEIFFLAQKQKLTFKEVAVNWSHGSDSKIHAIRDGIKSFMSLLKIRWNDLRGYYN